MEFDQYMTYRNAVSSGATSQNWADVAVKISKRTAPFTKAFMVERFGCQTAGNDTSNYVIAQLENQLPNIKNLIDRSYLKGAITALKNNNKKWNCTSSSLTVDPYKPGYALPDLTPNNSVWNSLQSILGGVFGGEGAANQIIDVNTGDQPCPQGFVVTAKGGCEPKGNNTIWWGVGALVVVGTVVGVVLVVRSRNKAGKK